MGKCCAKTHNCLTQPRSSEAIHLTTNTTQPPPPLSSLRPPVISTCPLGANPQRCISTSATMRPTVTAQLPLKTGPVLKSGPVLKTGAVLKTGTVLKTGPLTVLPAVQRPTRPLVRQPRRPPPIHRTRTDSGSLPLARPVVRAAPHTPGHGNSGALPGARHHPGHLGAVDARHSAGRGDDDDESGGRQRCAAADDERCVTSARGWDTQGGAAARSRAASSAVQRHTEEASGAPHGSGQVRLGFWYEAGLHETVQVRLRRQYSITNKYDVCTVNGAIHDTPYTCAAKHEKDIVDVMRRTRSGPVSMHGKLRGHQQGLGTRHGPTPITARYVHHGRCGPPKPVPCNPGVRICCTHPRCGPTPLPELVQCVCVGGWCGSCPLCLHVDDTFPFTRAR